MATAELEMAESRKQTFRRALDELENHASSILSLVEDQFLPTQNLVEERVKQLQSMEHLILVRYQQLEVKEKEQEIREKDFELRQYLEFEERCKEIELVAESSRKVKLVQESIQQHMEVLKEKEKQFELVNKSINEEIERRRKEFQLELKIFKQGVRDFEAREGRFKQRFEEFNLAKKQFDELTKDDMIFQKRLKELDWKEKQLEERLKVIELKEKTLEKPCEEVESKDTESATTTHNPKGYSGTGSASATHSHAASNKLNRCQDRRQPMIMRRITRSFRPYNLRSSELKKPVCR